MTINVHIAVCWFITRKSLILPFLQSPLIHINIMLYRLLNEAKGSLLDDEQLVNTLQTSKTTSQEVSEQLTIAEQTEIKIDNAREGAFTFL